MTELRILSIIPPMTQLNTPYPSTAYLTGFLRSRGVHAEQADLSIAPGAEVAVGGGPARLFRSKRAHCPRTQHTPATRFFAAHFEHLPHDHLAGHSIPAGPRPQPGASNRLETLPARRPALRVARSLRRAKRRRRRAGLGFRRARAAGSRATHRHAVPQRPGGRDSRCRRSALRVRALCRIAGGEPADVRSAAQRAARAAQPGRCDRCMH